MSDAIRHDDAGRAESEDLSLPDMGAIPPGRRRVRTGDAFERALEALEHAISDASANPLPKTLPVAAPVTRLQPLTKKPAVVIEPPVTYEKPVARIIDAPQTFIDEHYSTSDVGFVQPAYERVEYMTATPQLAVPVEIEMPTALSFDAESPFVMAAAQALVAGLAEVQPDPAPAIETAATFAIDTHELYPFGRATYRLMVM